MKSSFSKQQIALAAVAAIGTGALATAPTIVRADATTQGKYVAGDFHNHTTCSDGTISMQKLIGKATNTTDGSFGLDWFVQAGHGGNGNRNCTLVEDASLDTPAYPFVSGLGPNSNWVPLGTTLKGDVSGSGNTRNMWRWQSIQEYQYQVVEYLARLKNEPLFVGIETVVPGHEHTSMSVIAGQMPAAMDNLPLPTGPAIADQSGSRYVAVGDANALAQWEYCFDRADGDTSRGNNTGSNVGNNWDCSVTGSANTTDANWNPVAHKLIPASGAGNGTKGHAKTLEALKWMVEKYPTTSYYVPAHLERAGPFNPDGNNGYNVEHLRDMNNTAPRIAFGFETQPGHGASANRGEYQPLRNNINGTLTDSVGGTTYGGTGIYGAYVGGVWDALLGEGRNFWFFASSDWHNRGLFSADDRRTSQDFLPGEYQRNYTMVRNGADKIRPQAIVDGLRSGNNFAASGKLIDRLAFVACTSFAGPGTRSNASVEALAVAAASNGTDVQAAGCATMGQKLAVRAGADIVVSVVVRDPAGTNFSPYTFPNPSLAQIGKSVPINAPVLDHVDLIRGLVTGKRTPGNPDYAGAWPNTWLANPDINTVPAAARNTSAAVLKTFSADAPSAWTPVTSAVDGTPLLKMTYRIPAVTASQYVRLRGTNLPPATPFETDASGNPLTDLYTNANDTTKLSIPCSTTGTVLTGPAIDGCPAHLATASGASPITGQKASSFDVAAWSDLWFYSNPIYVQVTGGTVVAGVQ